MSELKCNEIQIFFDWINMRKMSFFLRFLSDYIIINSLPLYQVNFFNSVDNANL
jgi:hypothetical protein